MSGCEPWSGQYKPAAIRPGAPRWDILFQAREFGAAAGPQSGMKFSSGSRSLAAASPEIPNAGYPPGTSTIIKLPVLLACAAL